MENSNQITKRTEVGELTLSRVFENQYQKEGTKTAEFKQIVTTHASYPTKSVTNSLSDNLFSAEKDFGIETEDYSNESTRVAWILVPEDATEESVKEKLKKAPKAKLQRILSNHPILTSEQNYAIENGLTTKDAIATSQILRYPKGADKEGEIILDRNTDKPIYKVDVFRTGECEDLDKRNSVEDGFYLPEELKAEVDGNNAVTFFAGNK